MEACVLFFLMRVETNRIRIGIDGMNGVLGEGRRNGNEREDVGASSTATVGGRRQVDGR